MSGRSQDVERQESLLNDKGKIPVKGESDFHIEF